MLASLCTLIEDDVCMDDPLLIQAHLGEVRPKFSCVAVRGTRQRRRQSRTAAKPHRACAVNAKPSRDFRGRV